MGIAVVLSDKLPGSMTEMHAVRPPCGTDMEKNQVQFEKNIFLLTDPLLNDIKSYFYGSWSSLGCWRKSVNHWLCRFLAQHNIGG